MERVGRVDTITRDIEAYYMQPTTVAPPRTKRRREHEKDEAPKRPRNGVRS